MLGSLLALLASRALRALVFSQLNNFEIWVTDNKVNQ